VEQALVAGGDNLPDAFDDRRVVRRDGDDPVLTEKDPDR